MKVTDEQKEILEAVKKYKVIKINAFAGTGKTTTLKLIANEFKTKKILYLAFNTSIKNEASGIFPNNTYIKTTHGLAFAAIKKYTSINLNNIGYYRAIDISKEFSISYNQAIASLKIFENFCNNTQDEIIKDDLEHKTARLIFNYMMVGKLKPTHSFYLKYYYLLIKKEQINQYEYDIILLDEAQDTNEVTLGIFEYLNGKTKIYVGDQHQQIYSFRGSKNALQKIEANKTLYLSYSFRFDENIAFFANKLLKNFKNEKVQIKSKATLDESIDTQCYISRTNATLISIIAKRIDTRTPFVTIRDPNEIFSLTIEVYHLLYGDKKKIKKFYFLKEFKDEDELSDYANDAEDYELKSAIKVVHEYKDRVFEFKDISDKFYKAWQNRAMNGFEQRIKEILFLTTAHTSKGLEWDSVIIADDFVDFADLIVDYKCDSLEEFQKALDEETNYNQEILDEFNLFYVSITRAKKEIVKDSENFHYLLASNLEKVINKRVQDSKNILDNYEKPKKVKISKIQKEDKQLLRQEKNLKEAKPKNSGLKWSLEDKIKAKSLFNKNIPIPEIASKLERTSGAILGELLKSEVITKSQEIKLSKILKDDPILCSLNNI